MDRYLKSSFCFSSKPFFRRPNTLRGLAPCRHRIPPPLYFVSDWIHNNTMKYIIQTTDIFDNWLANLKDFRAKAKVLTRLERAAEGNLGDHKAIGSGVSEMRITEGKGYRLYYTIQGNIVVFMLIGGDKSTQQADIVKAIAIKKELDHD